MPVHVAGPRLYRSVPFKYLVKGAAGSGGGRASNISLNLTPFVDMMTILVTFLLMVFSSSGELLQAQRNLEMPLADSKGALQRAPVIIVSKSEITFQGRSVTTVDQVLKDDSPTMKIDELKEALEASAQAIKQTIDSGKDERVNRACEKQKQGLRAEDGNACPLGLAILQADKDTDARVINKIVNTAKIAGFDNLFFAIKNK